jgi:4-amino-4-deoxy-L-arabinose transferase-like glycosyltransferase
VARPLVLALGALAALTATRLLVAASVPLSPDETYYWVWSRALAPSYLDHPPMVALWIRAGTALAGHAALGIRLLAPLAAALGSWLLWDAGTRLIPGRHASLLAVGMLNATLLFGAGAVTMTPDTPLLFFWVCALWAMARIATGGRAAWWIAAGLFAGLAFASKYTAAFLGIGIGLWLLVAGRAWLSRPWPWLGGAAGIAMTVPVLWWNAAHGWASFAKQGGRLDAWHLGRAAQYLLELIGGQLGLATPLIFALCVAGVAAVTRAVWRTREPAATLLAMLSLPPVLVFIEHTFGGRVQGNWPAIIYPAAVIAAAGLTGAGWRRLVVPGIALGGVITAVVYAQAALAVFPLPVRYDPSALQLAGWHGLARQVEQVRRQRGAAFVAADQYGVAAELAYHLPPGVPAIGLGERWDLFALPPADMVGQTGLLVRSTRRGEISRSPPWARLRLISVAQRARDGIPVETYLIYQIIPSANPPGAVTLPRP